MSITNNQAPSKRSNKSSTDEAQKRVKFSLGKEQNTQENVRDNPQTSAGQINNAAGPSNLDHAAWRTVIQIGTFAQNIQENVRDNLQPSAGQINNVAQEINAAEQPQPSDVPPQFTPIELSLYRALGQPQPSDVPPQFTPIELSLYRALGQPQPSNQAIYIPSQRALLRKEVVDTQTSAYQTNNVAQEINAAGPSNQATAAWQPSDPDLFGPQINALIREILNLEDPEIKKKAQRRISVDISYIVKKALNFNVHATVENMSPQEQAAFRTLKDEIAEVVDTFRSDKTDTPKNLELLENEIKTAISNALETTIKDILHNPAVEQSSISNKQINALKKEISNLEEPETKKKAQIYINSSIIPLMTRKALNIHSKTTVLNMSLQEKEAFHTLVREITKVVDTFRSDKTNTPKNLELLENEIKTAISNALETTIKDILLQPINPVTAAEQQQSSIFGQQINALKSEILNLEDPEIKKKAQLYINRNIIPRMTKKALNINVNTTIADMSLQEKEAFYALKDKIAEVVDTFRSDKTDTPKNLELLENEIKTAISNALETTINDILLQPSNQPTVAEQPQPSIFDTQINALIREIPKLRNPETKYTAQNDIITNIVRITQKALNINLRTTIPNMSPQEQKAFYTLKGEIEEVVNTFRPDKTNTPRNLELLGNEIKTAISNALGTTIAAEQQRSSIFDTQINALIREIPKLRNPETKYATEISIYINIIPKITKNALNLGTYKRVADMSPQEKEAFHTLKGEIAEVVNTFRHDKTENPKNLELLENEIKTVISNALETTIAAEQPQPSNLDHAAWQPQTSVNPINNVAQEINTAGPSNPATAAEQQQAQIIRLQEQIKLREKGLEQEIQLQEQELQLLEQELQLQRINQAATAEQQQAQIIQLQEQIKLRETELLLGQPNNLAAEAWKKEAQMLQEQEQELQRLEQELQLQRINQAATAEQQQAQIIQLQEQIKLLEKELLRRTELLLGRPNNLAAAGPSHQAAAAWQQQTGAYQPNNLAAAGPSHQAAAAWQQQPSNQAYTPRRVLLGKEVVYTQAGAYQTNNVAQEINFAEFSRNQKISVPQQNDVEFTPEESSLYRALFEQQPSNRELEERVAQEINAAGPSHQAAAAAWQQQPSNGELEERVAQEINFAEFSRNQKISVPQQSDVQFTPEESSLYRALFEQQPSNRELEERVAQEINAAGPSHQAAAAAWQQQPSNGELEALWEETSRLLNIGSSFRDGTQQSLEQPQPSNPAIAAWQPVIQTGTFAQNIQGNVGDNPQTSVDQINNAEVTSNLYPAVQLQAGAYQTNNVAQEINAAGPSNQATAAEQQRSSIFDTQINALIREILNLEDPEIKEKAQSRISSDIARITKKALNFNVHATFENMSRQEKEAFYTLKGEIIKVVDTFRSDKTNTPKNLELLGNEIKTAISNALETTINDILLQPSTTVAEQPQPSILDTQINALIREIPKLEEPETKRKAQLYINGNIITSITKKALNLGTHKRVVDMSPQEQKAFYTLGREITKVVDTFRSDKTDTPKNLELLENEIKTVISNALETI